jgi:hypothetical protein
VESTVTTFKTALSALALLGATALISTTAEAGKFLESTHLQPSGRAIPGVQGTTITNSFGNTVPSRPSGGVTPQPPVPQPPLPQPPNCQKNPQECRG